MAHCHTDALATHSLTAHRDPSLVGFVVPGGEPCASWYAPDASTSARPAGAGHASEQPSPSSDTMANPVLDCGCPAQPAYTLTKGHHEPMYVCGHHGQALQAEATRQGFTVTQLDKARQPA